MCVLFKEIIYFLSPFGLLYFSVLTAYKAKGKYQLFIEHDKNSFIFSLTPIHIELHSFLPEVLLMCLGVCVFAFTGAFVCK